MSALGTYPPAWLLLALPFMSSMVLRSVPCLWRLATTMNRLTRPVGVLGLLCLFAGLLGLVPAPYALPLAIVGGLVSGYTVFSLPSKGSGRDGDDWRRRGPPPDEPPPPPVAGGPIDWQPCQCDTGRRREAGPVCPNLCLDALDAELRAGMRQARGPNKRCSEEAWIAWGTMVDAYFSGRVALVTGASGGIGAAISTRLAASGAAVAVHYVSNAVSAQRVVDSIASSGGRAAAFAADFRNPDGPERLLHTVRESLGSVELLVANAALGRRGTLEEVGAAEFDEMLAVNLRAPYLLARGALPTMRQHRFGRIVFISSVAGLTGGILGPHYASSKAGLHGLTHYIASRVASDGVTVNAIAPALIQDTDMLPGDPGDLAERIPVGRLGTPGEVADLTMAVLRNGYVTNTIVSIDGGMYPR